MFQTEVCRALAESVSEKTLHAVQAIQKLNFDEAEAELKLISQEITRRRDTFSDSNSDEVFNEGFILSVFVELFLDYVSYWRLLVSDQYSESWSALQDVQDQLRTIYRYIKEPRPAILKHIEKQCGELEKLYPYQVFFSVGLIKEKAECSICGKSIDNLECEHIAGELYRGRRAYGIVKKIKQLDHVAVVTNPADKRCTVQLLNTDEQFKGVAYLANGIRNEVLDPLGFSHLEFTEIRKSNKDMTIVGRNDPCPCGSGNKFKKCCIDKSYIETTHVNIVPGSVNLANLLDS
jgi:hypothetical protein